MERVTLHVHNPAGSVEVVQSHAARVEELDGRTICELSNGVWEDERTFAKIRESLQRRLPGARIVPFTEFPIGSEQIDNERTIDLLVEKGCQAVIAGNAA
jgi:hypothetical protein